MSTLVSTASRRMPRSSQTPDVPQPVPISTTALAPRAAAMNRKVAPTTGLTGEAPPTCAALRRAMSKGSSSGRNSST
jgi:hypothetical protein